MSNGLTRRGLLGAAGATALGAPALAQSGSNIQWKMITSWPKNLPGPGVTARRLAERITAMSDGALNVRLFAAGELVSALQVFDGVANGVAQMGHTASFFWQGKMTAAPFFTAIPFGLNPIEHQAWIYHGGGQDLWDKLYEPFGIRAFMAGNTGMSMGGWFKAPVRSLDDINGLKIRMPGLGGEVYRRLGATTVAVAPPEITSSLDAGIIDATEFLGPASDLALGFHRIASVYHWPGFHEPNGTGEALISQAAWNDLPPSLQEIVRNACAAENSFALAEIERDNARALNILVEEHNVRIEAFPGEVINAARRVAEDVLAEFVSADGITGEIADSYALALAQARGWSKFSQQAFLEARNN